MVGEQVVAVVEVQVVREVFYVVQKKKMARIDY